MGSVGSEWSVVDLDASDFENAFWPYRCQFKFVIYSCRYLHKLPVNKIRGENNQISDITIKQILMNVKYFVNNLLQGFKIIGVIFTYRVKPSLID